MIAFGRQTIAVTGLALTLAGCSGEGADPSPSATAPAPTPTESTWVDPASLPLAGTTLVDPASAVRVSDGSVTSELVATFGNGGARDVTVALAPDGSRLVLRILAGSLENDAIVKPSEFAWFDGTFHPLGSTADMIPGDAARQSFSEWTDGETTAWVESPSIEASPFPWRLFAAGRDGGPVLITTSEDAEGHSDTPWAPDPVVYDGRVYWESQAPAGTVTGTGTWSAPVTGGDRHLELVGASRPAATDAGVFALSEVWGPEGDASLEPGAVRVTRVDGDPSDQTLRTLDVNPDGKVGRLHGEGRWLAAQYQIGFGDSGITVFSASTGEGYSIAPLDDALSADVALCDAALVWLQYGEDWSSDTIYRLDLDSGELIVFDAPRAFRINDCQGDDVLWSQTEGGKVNRYLTTVG
ncbi:hypothetical protein LGT39_02460 [Demequina sp. TTPB684]|uniref:hypothetical protein n=1 Tax=unclassified Demequina TaxID=2620311 RepID=UPI001CF1ED85|nr:MULTISPECIES: hypothetical protein [unclassified Demequina]MCB2411710.1 hypothetical protein [Demequina sp. TTPB684]UPU88171.1 hypothetical protein LGT36_013125 [Demequina sp. TMPB413]